jgi:uncharacterized iron-regulated membrane protein
LKAADTGIGPGHRPSAWLRANLWLHRWCSLLATLPFLILCLTGTVLIFHKEIDVALGVVPTAQSLDGAAHRPLAESVNAALAAYPGERVAMLGIDAQHYPGVLLVGMTAEGTHELEHMKNRFTELATASLRSGRGDGITLTGFLLELHGQWFMGVVGELLGALIALLVVLSLVSGLVVYAPFVKKVAFGALRRGKSPRLRQLDLHNFIGAIVLGWALVVSATGFLLGFGTLVTGVWSQGALAQIQLHYGGAPVDPLRPPVNADQAYQAALAAMPQGWTVSSIIFPGTAYSTDRHYTVLANGSGLDEKLFRVALVDGADGRVVAVLVPPWYMKAILVSQPLHFGDYGGLPLKMLWTLCTWLTLFITANGAWLWWDRRRGHRRHSLSNAEVSP